jgi:hypothetical protein
MKRSEKSTFLTEEYHSQPQFTIVVNLFCSFKHLTVQHGQLTPIIMFLKAMLNAAKYQPLYHQNVTMVA